MTAFGIDFGTTNSVLAAAIGHDIETVSLDDPPGEWVELGFDKVLPTVLAESGHSVIFGWQAKRSKDRLEAVKRLFSSDDDAVKVGSQTIEVEAAAGVFFRHIKDRASEAGHTLDQAVVTIPANSRGSARFRTKISAGLSGIEVLALLNEPTAAAMAYARHIPDGHRVLIFDWGGGTLDVTILRKTMGVFMEEASKGIQKLGGIDVDTAFRAALKHRVPSGSELDPFDVERAKIQLSKQESTVIPLIGGETIEVTRGEFEDAVRSLVVMTRGPIEKCLQDLGDPKVDHLVLVGGSSKMPMVARYVREMLRLDPMEGVDPMTAVAEGAALAAGILTGAVRDLDFYVGTEHALGTVTHTEQNEARFSVLIPRNTKLPASATDGFSPLVDNTDSVLVRVIEGDPDVDIDHDDNVILKEWDVDLMEPRPASEAGFSISFEYDVDGILKVRVVDFKTGTVMMDDQLSFGAAKTKQDLVELRRRVDAIDVNPDAGGSPLPEVEEQMPSPPPASGLSEESRAAVRKAKEKIYHFVDDETQTLIDDQIRELVNAAPEDEADARQALERTVRDHAYLL